MVCFRWVFADKTTGTAPLVEAIATMVKLSLSSKCKKRYASFNINIKWFLTFHFGTDVLMCHKKLVGVWDGKKWDPSHPFQVLEGHPTEIPPKRILGGVVYNYRLQYMYTALMLRWDDFFHLRGWTLAWPLKLKDGSKVTTKGFLPAITEKFPSSISCLSRGLSLKKLYSVHICVIQG